MRVRVTISLVLLCALLVDGRHGDDGEHEVEDSDPTTMTPSQTLSSSVSTELTSSRTAPSTVPTSSTTPVSSSSALQFMPPQNVSTCEDTTFSWTYSGNSQIQLTLTVTNERVVQQTVSSGGPTSIPLVSRVVSSNVSSNANTVTWEKVDVIQGWYAVIASGNVNVSAQSAPFFVKNGTNTACFVAIPTTTSALSSSTSVSTSVLPSSTGTASSAHLDTGGLIGTIAGVLVGICILTAVFMVPRFWRRALPTHRRRPGGPYYLF